MALQLDKLTRIVAWVFGGEQPIAVCGSALTATALSVYDGDTGALLWSVTDTVVGHQTAVGPDQSVVLGAKTVFEGADDNYVVKYDADGAELWSNIIVPKENPDFDDRFRHMECDPDGHVIFVFGTFSDAARLGKLNADSGSIIWMIEGQDVADITGIAIDPDGNILAATGSNGFKKFSGSSGGMIWTTGGTEEFNDPACDGDGNVFVRHGLPGGARELRKYSTGGNLLATRSFASQSRSGLDCDAGGAVWCVTDDAIRRFGNDLVAQEESIGYATGTEQQIIVSAAVDDRVAVLKPTLGAFTIYEQQNGGAWAAIATESFGTRQDMSRRWNGE